MLKQVLVKTVATPSFRDPQLRVHRDEKDELQPSPSARVDDPMGQGDVVLREKAP